MKLNINNEDLSVMFDNVLRVVDAVADVKEEMEDYDTVNKLDYIYSTIDDAKELILKLNEEGL